MDENTPLSDLFSSIKNDPSILETHEYIMLKIEIRLESNVKSSKLLKKGRNIIHEDYRGEIIQLYNEFMTQN